MKIYNMECASVLVTDKKTGELLVVVNDDEMFCKRGLEIWITQDDHQDINVNEGPGGKLFVKKKMDFRSVS